MRGLPPLKWCANSRKLVAKPIAANEKQKNHADSQDLDEIIAGILENPLPQMIYFWNSLSNEKKLVLSLLVEILTDTETYIQAQEVQ